MEINEILNIKNSSVHFIGIGGVSMSSLAKLLKEDGHKISGSDMNLSGNVKKLMADGIEISIGHSEDNLKDCDMVVYTAAISKDNPELLKAKEKGILTIERCDLLGEMMKGYKYPVNISGTHGKTTTTSMVSSVFLEAGVDPTISIGGDFDKIGGNLNIGSKDYFICEACEYVESFLKFYPYITVILNIEEDHLDYFSGIEHIKNSFLKFAERTDKNGFVVINGDDENCRSIKDKIPVKTYTFGFSTDNDIYADNMTFKNGHPVFDVYYKNEFYLNIELSVYGEHNVLNALATTLCAILCDIDKKAVKKGLETFGGAKRRFEYKGKYKNADIYDDYAHHPTEIETTINSAHKKEYNNLYVVFQPHTYTRTKAFINEFAEVLKKAENVIIADIYAAREKNIYSVSSKDLADKIPTAKYIGSLEEIENYLRENIKDNDMVLTVGAGDVFKIGENLISKDA